MNCTVRTDRKQSAGDLPFCYIICLRAAAPRAWWPYQEAIPDEIGGVDTAQYTQQQQSAVTLGRFGVARELLDQYLAGVNAQHTQRAS